MALGVAIIVKSGSRGQLVFALSAVVIMELLQGKARSLRSVLGSAIALVVLGFMTFEVYEAFVGERTRWEVRDVVADARGRVEMVRVMIERWWASPVSVVFGLGNSASWSVLGVYPHVVPAEVLVEEGLVGSFLFGGLTVAAMKAWRRAKKCLGAGERVVHESLLVLGAWGIFSALLSTKQGSLATSPMLLLFPVLVERIGNLCAQRRG
jgi:hypothetical protein